VLAAVPISDKRSDTGVNKKKREKTQHREVLATSEVQQTETTTQRVK